MTPTGKVLTGEVESICYIQQSRASVGSELIFTDDVSLQVFFQHLQKLAVAP
ncbi:unnamed protein product [Rhodiola kirilowii]